MENLVTYTFVCPYEEDILKGDPVYFHGKQVGNVISKTKLRGENRRSVLKIECRPLFVPGTVGVEIDDSIVKLKLIR